MLRIRVDGEKLLRAWFTRYEWYDECETTRILRSKYNIHNIILYDTIGHLIIGNDIVWVVKPYYGHTRQTVYYTIICNSPTYNRIPKELNIVWYLHTKYYNIQSIMFISCGRAVKLCAKDTREDTKYGYSDRFSDGKTYNI